MKARILSTISIFMIFSVIVVCTGSASAAGEYTHPSGAFSVTEFGTLEAETDNGALFVEDGAMVMMLFGKAQVEVSQETVPDIVRPILDGIQEFDDYELDYEQVVELDNGYVISFQILPGTGGSQFTSGDAFVAQNGDVLYVLLLLAEDYDAIAEDWEETVISFTPLMPAEEEETTPTPEEETPATPEAGVEVGELLSGFDPQIDGFNFENYGNETSPTNLIPADLVRMFGDQVCAGTVNDECILTSPAQQWMEQVNGYMDDGHCEGMAVLSSLMYYQQVDPAQFGSLVVHDLDLDDNQPLQREIAYWWTTQATYPGSAVRVDESAGAVLDTLIESFEQGTDASEWWAMGIYQRDGSAGHAITPIGVEDLGDGRYNILIYDNNYPDETRVVEVDRASETWQYEGSPNPELESFLYDGDAGVQNLELVAISPRMEPQDCEFCSGGGAGDQGSTRGSLALKGAAGPDYPAWENVQKRWAILVDGDTGEYYQIWLTGDSVLLIVDDWGRGIGYLDDEFINQIPGASTQNMKIFSSLNLAGEGDTPAAGKGGSPVYRIPVGLSFDVIVDGSYLKEESSSDVAMIGPGYYLDVSGIWLEPGEMDSVGVHIDKSRHQLTYRTDYSVSPDIEMGLETEEASYAFLVTATELVGAEDTFDVALDMDTNEFILNTSDNTETSIYQVYVLRIDEEGERVFGYDEVEMDPDNTAYIPFTEWEGQGTGLRIDFDLENDGEIDGSIDLPDITDSFDFYDNNS